MNFLKQTLHKIKNYPVLSGIVLYFAAMWSWMLFTDTLDLAGNSTQGMIIAVIVLAVNTTLSSAIIWQGFKVSKLLLKKYSSKAVFLIVPLFALTDWLVAWVPSIIWLGPEGRVDSILPLASPTIFLVNTPLAFSARIIGFFGLAGFTWAIIALALSKKYKNYSAILAGVLVAISFIGWIGYKNTNGTSFTATVISEGISDRVKDINTDGSELIVFPEYGLDVLAKENPEDRLPKTTEEKKTYFLGSMQQFSQEGLIGHYNTLLYGNTTDGITTSQDKFRLIPGGEDLGFIVRIALRATNQVDTLNYFSFAKGVISGSHQLVPMVVDENTVVGAAVCSSIIAPQDYRTFAQNGATAFSNSASLTIFKGSPLFAWQQKSMAKFMAIANSRYFMQSANAARAYVLDNNGQTITEVTGISATTAVIKNNSTKTVYTIFGEWLMALGALSASILLILYARKRKS